MNITIPLPEYTRLKADEGYRARYEKAAAAINNALENGGDWAIKGVLCECGTSCMANDWRGMYLFDPQDVEELRKAVTDTTTTGTPAAVKRGEGE